MTTGCILCDPASLQTEDIHADVRGAEGLRVADLNPVEAARLRLRLGAPTIFPHHHPAWSGVLKAAGEDCRVLVAFDGDEPAGWLLYTVLSRPLGTVVNSLPYIAYGGPAVPDGTEPVVRSVLAALREKAEVLGADVLNVCTSPWLSERDELLYRQALGVTHEHENFVQVQDLDAHPLTQVPKERRDVLRSQINRATKAGLRVRSQLAPDQFAEWLEIYRARYAEMGAKPYPDEFHRAAFEIGVPTGLVEFWGVFDGTTLLGANMYVIHGHRADYFSSAFRSSCRNLSPNTFALNAVFDSLMERGVKYFNWQSSPNREGVYRYKAHWGAREYRHFYMSVLLRPETAVLRSPIPTVRAAYPFRFVLPFSAWPVVAEPRV